MAKQPITLSYDKIIIGVFFLPSVITGAESEALIAAFPSRTVTAEDVENIIPGILCNWPAAKLRKCTARALEMFRKAEIASNPPPMMDEKAIRKLLSHAMTIRITEKNLAKLLYVKRGANLEICYEYDDGSAMRDPHIPAAYLRNFDRLGGSSDAFIAWLESKGAKPAKVFGKGRKAA